MNLEHARQTCRVGGLTDFVRVQDHAFPAEELVELVQGHPHDVQEDDRREHPRDVDDEVATTLRRDGVDQLAGQPTVVITHGSDAAGREI